MTNANERKEEAWLLRRAENEGGSVTDSDCGREPGQTGGTTKYQQVGSDRTNSEGFPRGSSVTDAGETTLGGMLRQLREIRQDYLAYIESHSERLKQRLAEDEERREQVIKKAEILEQAIIDRFEESITTVGEEE